MGGCVEKTDPALPTSSFQPHMPWYLLFSLNMFISDSFCLYIFIFIDMVKQCLWSHLAFSHSKPNITKHLIKLQIVATNIWMQAPCVQMYASIYYDRSIHHYKVTQYNNRFQTFIHLTFLSTPYHFLFVHAKGLKWPACYLYSAGREIGSVHVAGVPSWFKHIL